jgi:hypothetical protein
MCGAADVRGQSATPAVVLSSLRVASLTEKVEDLIDRLFNSSDIAGS